MSRGHWLTIPEARARFGVSEAAITGLVYHRQIAALRWRRPGQKIDGEALALHLERAEELPAAHFERVRALRLEQEKQARVVRSMAAMAAREARTDHWVYKMYDVAGRLLYVGITWRSLERLHSHQRLKPWSPNVETIRMEHFATREEAERRELELIRSADPIHNVAGKVTVA